MKLLAVNVENSQKHTWYALVKMTFGRWGNTRCRFNGAAWKSCLNLWLLVDLFSVDLCKKGFDQLTCTAVGALRFTDLYGFSQLQYISRCYMRCDGCFPWCLPSKHQHCSCQAANDLHYWVATSIFSIVYTLTYDFVTALRLHQVVSISQQEAQSSPHISLSKEKQHIKTTAGKEVSVGDIERIVKREEKREREKQQHKKA